MIKPYRTHKLILSLMAALLVMSCAKSGDVATRQADYLTAKDEKLMERAIRKAKATQHEFLEALQNRDPNTTGFAIKKPFPAGEDKEHIWLNEVSWDGRKFSAKVNNDPVDTKAVKLGDKVQVTPEELSDWMYIENGVLRGGYTIRVLHYQSSPKEQKEFLKHVPFSIPPIDF